MLLHYPILIDRKFITWFEVNLILTNFSQMFAQYILENKCAKCRLNKAKTNNTSTNIHINSSGRSYNLGMLAGNPDGHCMSLDQLGPIFGQNGKKFWAYIFYSHNCAMVFTMLTDDLSALNVHLCVNLLTSYIGKITLLISDQQSAFQPFATNFEMENISVLAKCVNSKYVWVALPRLLESLTVWSNLHPGY